MERLFLEECYERDPLKNFRELQNSRQCNYMDGIKDRKDRVQLQFEEMDREVNVHVCWILVWIGMLQY